MNLATTMEDIKMLNGKEISHMLLSDPDKVYPPYRKGVPVLSDGLRHDLDQLRQEVRTHCEQGKEDAAERTAALAWNILRMGINGKGGV